MTLFYRLLKQKHANDAFSGTGAKLYGGRWNSKGRPCVYLGSSIALCTLETLVHLQDESELDAFALFTLEIQDKHILEITPTDLPGNWRDDPPPSDLQLLGDAWLSSGASLVLLVPSCITGEMNALFNPEHPAATEALATVTRAPFPIDPRLVKKK